MKNLADRQVPSLFVRYGQQDARACSAWPPSVALVRNTGMDANVRLRHHNGCRCLGILAFFKAKDCRPYWPSARGETPLLYVLASL
jgi:hypothetical protein